MSFKRHPSEASILSVLNGTASAEEQALVANHLAICPRCQSVSAHKELLLLQLKQFAPQHAKDYAPIAAPQPSKRWFTSSAGLRFAGAAVAASLFFIFAWPRHIQTVSAAELLSRAESAEVNVSDSPRFYRLHVGSAICNTADAHWSAAANSAENPCTRVRNELQQTNWDDHRMLSAHSYKKWHDGLSQHRDSVSHQEPYWTLKTDTSQGTLRSASLRVRSSDYRPVELTLEFAALQAVSVVEDEPAERHIYVPAREPGQLAKNDTPKHVDEPADAIEVQAWQMLRTLNADSGWEATITRRGGEVRVVGYVVNPTRRDKLQQSFATIQGVTIDLNRPEVLPRRGSSGDAQPLAEHALEALIPDSHERGKRITGISDASRAVVGKAFLHDALIARRTAFQESPSAHALTPLIEAERADLLAQTIRLSDLLDPLVEPGGNHGLRSALGYPQARKLDSAVLSLVNAAPRQSASLDQTKAVVHSLLPGN